MTKKTDNSYVLYLHRELRLLENWWKAGRAITPYSAVRLRQRLVHDQFCLEHVYFGNPEDIKWLEKRIHSAFPGPDNTYCNKELVQVEEARLLAFIDHQISHFGLEITHLGDNYTAHRSQHCPYGFPVEKDIHEWARDKLEETFGTQRGKFRPKNEFVNLFSFEA